MSWEVVITSDPRRERLFAELYWNGEQIAEVYDEGEGMRVQLWGPASGTAWDLAFDELMQGLSQAKERMRRLDEPQPDR